MSNLGKWDKWYENLKEVDHYGHTLTYEMGAEFLKDCETVEDWGCGKGWFKRYRTDGYIGIDGSNTPFADKIEDLAKYKSSPDGIFMRHVLEHNYEWEKVLENALDSFQQKMALIIFTPFAEETTKIGFTESVGVPDLSFKKDDIISKITDRNITYELIENMDSVTAYGVEHIFFLTKELA